MNQLLREVLPALGVDKDAAARHVEVLAGNVLPSALPVNTLACGAVAAAGLAGLAVRGGERVHVDPRQVAVAFRNDQLQTVDGHRTARFGPLSGFFETADGWVRTHANYPHHRDRLVRALGLGPEASRDDAAAALKEWTAQEVEDTVTRDAGVAVRVRDVGEWMAGEQAAAVRDHDLLEVSRDGTVAATRLPDRPRVLDLTRVIAGPVATRTLAYLGCDVLRVDNPSLPEIREQHIDTGAGKRSTLVNLHNEHARARVHDLLAGADVLVTGYRPGALATYHLDAASLAERHPHLVVATLTAWTPSGPWGRRRGFDSIVQAATGISMAESADGGRPGAMPAQALDHATGYLLAAGILSALRRRAEEGGTWRVSAHLARTAHWLLQTDAVDAPAGSLVDPEPWMVASATGYGRVVQARPAFQIDDGPREFAWVGRRWGTDEAAWVSG